MSIVYIVINSVLHQKGKKKPDLWDVLLTPEFIEISLLKLKSSFTSTLFVLKLGVFMMSLEFNF